MTSIAARQHPPYTPIGDVDLEEGRRGEGSIDSVNTVNSVNANTSDRPLVGDGSNNTAGEPRPGGNPAWQVRMSMAGDGASQVTTSRFMLWLTILINSPQILATVVILSLHWEDVRDCDEAQMVRYKWWALIAAVQIFLYTLVSILVFKVERGGHDISSRLLSARNSVDALGLSWFVVGNLWLFSGQEGSCTDPGPIYTLCVVLLLITYLHICLPCILAVILIPVLCFCLPVLLRVLPYLHDPRAGKGASRETIDKLPLINFGDTERALALGAVLDDSCPICLGDYTVSEEIRVLQCHHAMHKGCVDEWLQASGTCPICRQPILSGNEPPPAPSQPAPGDVPVSTPSSASATPVDNLIR